MHATLVLPAYILLFCVVLLQGQGLNRPQDKGQALPLSTALFSGAELGGVGLVSAESAGNLGEAAGSSPMA